LGFSIPFFNASVLETLGSRKSERPMFPESEGNEESVLLLVLFLSKKEKTTGGKLVYEGDTR
jgi:hypothetical protein